MDLYDKSSVTACVELPSRGKLYDGKLPDGKVKIRAMTARDEKLLYGGKGGAMDKVETLLAGCCSLPDGFSPSELLVADRFFLLIKIRMLSLGSDYPVRIKCPECSHQFIHDLDLAELCVKFYEENQDVAEPFSVMLPVLGKSLQFRLLRGKDEAAIQRHAKSNMVRGGDMGDNSYVYSFARALVALDGAALSLQDAVAMVEDMVSRDLVALRHAIEENEPGVDQSLFIECPACGYLLETALPFTDEFFRPRRRSLRGGSGATV